MAPSQKRTAESPREFQEIKEYKSSQIPLGKQELNLGSPPDFSSDLTPLSDDSPTGISHF